MSSKARVIAIYLPQYHPTEENNLYWGPGFTEWDNVVKARPLFPGHYQPKLPADLGFYDLRLPEVREAQAQMARDAGIEGFMYWQYWFGNGKMTLHRPFEEVLASGKPDFPFCLGWANHSWTNKTWRKGKAYSRLDPVIFQQQFPGDDDHWQHFQYNLPAFRDPRYICVDGKPIFVIWSPHEFPGVSRFMDLWRKWAKEAGLPGIHFVGMRLPGCTLSVDGMREAGFDAVNNSGIDMYRAETKARGSRVMKRALTLISKMFNLPLSAYNYKTIIKNLCSDDDYRTDVYPTLLPGYDRSPRSGRRAQIYYNNTPKLFGRHIDDVMQHIAQKPADRRIVLLKSWNEWGEGNYIEPDQRYGRAYLDELRQRIK